MSKKKQIGIAIGVIVLVIAGFVGKYQYDQYQAEQNRNFSKMSLLFMVMDPEDKDLVKSNYTATDFKEFIKNPPKIEIDTASGLELKVSAYNYYHDEDIDPYLIQEMMETGEFHEAYEYTIDLVHWSNNYGNDILAYQYAISYAADKLETPLPLPENTTYQDYLTIINNPDGQKYIDEYYEIKGNLIDD